VYIHEERFYVLEDTQRYQLDFSYGTGMEAQGGEESS
jgi:hypothetical protein